MNLLTKEKLLELELFNELKEETLTNLCNIAYIKKVKKGEHIFRDKEKENFVYIVLKGKMSLYKLNEGGHKKVVFILGKDTILNEVIFDDLSSSINCEVFEQGEILFFHKRKFIEIMEKDFYLTSVVIKSLASKVRRLYRQVKNTTPIKMEKKLAAKLCKLSKDYGVLCEEGVLIDLNISITYLADMFGAPRETISRAMKMLQQKELVLMKNKKITIKDSERLAEYFKGK